MISFEENIGLVHSQAKLGFKWAQGAGLALSYDDMFQEASLAFLLAAEGYDATTGNKFSTYYTMAAFSQFRKSIGLMTGVKNLNPQQREEIADRRALNKERAARAEAPLLDCNYGLSPVAFSHIGVGLEDDYSFEEGLASDTRSPEQIVEFRQELRQITKDLSPLAALIVDWLRDPPPELERELSSQAAHADLRNELGVRGNRQLRDGLSIASIGRFLKLTTDVTDGELSQAKAELDRVIERIEEI